MSRIVGIVVHVVYLCVLGKCCRKKSMTLLKIFLYFRFVSDFLQLLTLS